MGNNGTVAGLVSSCLPEAVPSHDCWQPSCRAKSSNFLRCSTFSARMTRFDLVYLATLHLALDVPLSTSRPFLPSARPSSIYRKKSVTQRALAVRNAAPRPLSTTHAIDPYTRSTASSNINVVAMCAGGSRGRNYLETHMLDREYFRIQFRWRNSRLNIYRFYNCRTGKRVLRNEIAIRCLSFRTSEQILFITSNQVILNGIGEWGCCVFRSRDKLYVLRMFMLVEKCVTRPSKHARYRINNWNGRIRTNK